MVCVSRRTRYLSNVTFSIGHLSWSAVRSLTCTCNWLGFRVPPVPTATRLYWKRTLIRGTCWMSHVDEPLWHDFRICSWRFLAWLISVQEIWLRYKAFISHWIESVFHLRNEKWERRRYLWQPDRRRSVRRRTAGSVRRGSPRLFQAPIPRRSAPLYLCPIDPRPLVDNATWVR